jgi:hypothetical protein
VTLNLTSKVCAIEPFRYQSTPQPGGDDGASGNQINDQAIEDYLSRLRTAICEDVEAIIEAAGTGGGGVDEFIELTDTPASYVGAGGDLVAVKAAEDGLEFVPFPVIPEIFTDLDDVPASYTGSAGLPVVVNNTEDGLIFGSFPSSTTLLAKWINFSFALVATTPFQTIGHGGSATSASGANSSIPTLATTNVSTGIYKLETTSANAANSIAHFGIATLLVAIGTTGDWGGFRFRMVVGGNSTIANQRAFWGLRAAITTPTSVDPSSQTNIIGVGYDAGATTLSVMHNDGAGTATSVGLGANFPVATGELFDILLECVPGSSTVSYTVIRLNTGDTATGTLSTNLPADTQFLSTVAWVATAGTAGVARLWFHHQYLSYY